MGLTKVNVSRMIVKTGTLTLVGAVTRPFPKFTVVLNVA